MPFLRRRQENEPDTPAPSVAPAAPEPAAAELVPAPAPNMPLLNEPLQAPDTQASVPVESQFQPVEGADEMLDMPLGTLIFRAGLIAPQQLEDALAEGLRSGKRLGEVLLSRGWLSEDDLSRLLAGQKGLPYADLERIAVDRELAQAMSYDDARSEMALPVVAEFGLPVVAMADPDEAAMERLRAQLGPEIRFVVGAPSVLTRLIDEVLGGAPAPGLLVAQTADAQSGLTEPIESTEPSASDQGAAPDLPVEQYVPTEPLAEPVPPEAVESEPALPEPVALDSSDQEAPAAAPDLAAEEIRPIIAEGEVDYPTFSEYQPIPETEIIKGSDEQLPAEVQMGDYGYYDDSSLLEGNAWQAGETGPPATEPAAEITDPGADQYAPQPFEERPAPEDVEQPLEEAETPVDMTEQPLEEAEAPVEEAEPPFAEAEQPVEQAWDQPSPEIAPEPVASDVEELALEPGEAAEAPSGEEDLATTPAWMRGEVNVITADVADFIDSGASTAPETPAPPASENGDVAGREPEPVVNEFEAPVEPESIPEEPAEEEAVEQLTQPELVEIEPAAAELGAETPSWASEPIEAEQAPGEEVYDAPPEPLVPEKESARESGLGAYELVLRLVDGDRMRIGSFDTVEGAQEKAAEVVKQFGEIKEGGWPFIGGRFLRPETIVSIDVEEHSSGWGGSNTRGRMFSGEENA